MMNDYFIYNIQVGEIQISIPNIFLEIIPEINKLKSSGDNIASDVACLSLLRAIIEESSRGGTVKISKEKEPVMDKISIN